MNASTTYWKPRLHFDAMANAPHVTFDDGQAQRLNLPWFHFAEARWDYKEPDLIRMLIGDSMVLLQGRNMGLLFASIEDQSLLRVRAHPEMEDDKSREMDSFVTSIRFSAAPTSSLS